MCLPVEHAFACARACVCVCVGGGGGGHAGIHVHDVDTAYTVCLSVYQASHRITHVVFPTVSGNLLGHLERPAGG